MCCSRQKPQTHIQRFLRHTSAWETRGKHASHRARGDEALARNDRASSLRARWPLNASDARRGRGWVSSFPTGRKNVPRLKIFRGDIRLGNPPQVRRPCPNIARDRSRCRGVHRRGRPRAPGALSKWRGERGARDARFFPSISKNTSLIINNHWNREFTNYKFTPMPTFQLCY